MAGRGWPFAVFRLADRRRCGKKKISGPFVENLTTLFLGLGSGFDDWPFAVTCRAGRGAARIGEKAASRRDRREAFPKAA